MNVKYLLEYVYTYLIIRNPSLALHHLIIGCQDLQRPTLSSTELRDHRTLVWIITLLGDRGKGITDKSIFKGF